MVHYIGLSQNNTAPIKANNQASPITALPNTDEMELSVKFGGQNHQIILNSPLATIADLQVAIEQECNVMTRQQKIIVKGKVITGLKPNHSLSSLNISTGSKLMLLSASTTQQQQSQGQAALNTRHEFIQQAAKQRKIEDNAMSKQPQHHKHSESIVPTNIARWAKTGICSLRDLNLTSLPPQLFSPQSNTSTATTIPSYRVMDCSGNRLISLPFAMTSLSALQKLRLTGNALGTREEEEENEGQASSSSSSSPHNQLSFWNILTQLTSLVVLCLDNQHPPLASIQPSISNLMQLTHLSLSNNRIQQLPAEIGQLTSLKVLNIAGNKKISRIPPEIGQCRNMEEINMSDNCITNIPVEMALLGRLRELVLDSNRIATVPSEVLQQCTSLQTLLLHDNVITAEKLRTTLGYYEGYEGRRKAKEDKKVGMKVLLNKGGFDEGVDVDDWEHFKQ
jgi:Leucine-rich repeat (LRR) protein